MNHLPHGSRRLRPLPPPPARLARAMKRARKIALGTLFSVAALGMLTFEAEVARKVLQHIVWAEQQAHACERTPGCSDAR